MNSFVSIDVFRQDVLHVFVAKPAGPTGHNLKVRPFLFLFVAFDTSKFYKYVSKPMICFTK